MNDRVRFALEWESVADAPSALVTAGRTERQKRNRAFAAELLAPSRWLQDWCAGEYVGPDELADAAATLGVSTEVVHRQLQNHGIAHFLS